MPLGPFSNLHGMAASPVLFQDKADPGLRPGQQFLPDGAWIARRAERSGRRSVRKWCTVSLRRYCCDAGAGAAVDRSRVVSGTRVFARRWQQALVGARHHLAGEADGRGEPGYRSS